MIICLVYSLSEEAGEEKLLEIKSLFKLENKILDDELKKLFNQENLDITELLKEFIYSDLKKCIYDTLEENQALELDEKNMIEYGKNTYFYSEEKINLLKIIDKEKYKAVLEQSEFINQQKKI